MLAFTYVLSILLHVDGDCSVRTSTVRFLVCYRTFFHRSSSPLFWIFSSVLFLSECFHFMTVGSRMRTVQPSFVVTLQFLFISITEQVTLHESDKTIACMVLQGQSNKLWWTFFGTLVTCMPSLLGYYCNSCTTKDNLRRLLPSVKQMTMLSRSSV